MKLTITHLNAPWPASAKVGDVVELEVVPAWAVGKCSPAPEDAEVTVEGEAGVPAVVVESLAAANTGSSAGILGVDLQTQIADLQAQLDSAVAENSTLAEGKADAEAKAADLQAQLDAIAAKAAADARAALEAEATALGLTFRSNISDETLAARIAEAKANAAGTGE